MLGIHQQKDQRLDFPYESCAVLHTGNLIPDNYSLGNHNQYPHCIYSNYLYLIKS